MKELKISKGKNNINKDMMDVATMGIIGGASLGIINSVEIPAGAFPNNTGENLRQGANSLIGVGMLSQTSKKMKKYL